MQDGALVELGARRRVWWPDGTGGRDEGELQRLDTSELGAYYLLRTDRGTRVKLSARAATLLVAPDSDETSAVALAAQLSGYDLRRGGPRRRRGFLFTIRLVRADYVAAASALLAPAFALPVALAVLALTLTAFIAFATLRPAWQLTTPLQVLEVYGLYVLSALIHEFGHAAAVRRYGGRPGEIGFTQYLAFPAFFSDVSEAWHLTRWQRVAVDLGGSYFQLAAAAAFIVMYLLTGAAAWADVVWLIVGTSAFNLNPVLRLDGYWMLADALGVCNLSRQPLLMVQDALARMRGQEAGQPRWPARVVALLGVYTVASVVFWLYFMYAMTTQLFAESAIAGGLVTIVLHGGRAALTAANAGQAVSILASLVLIMFALFWTVTAFARGLRTIALEVRGTASRRSIA